MTPSKNSSSTSWVHKWKLDLGSAVDMNVKLIARIFSLLATMVFLGVVQATPPSSPILPLIELQDTPLSKAISQLARQSEINLLFDATLFPNADSNDDSPNEPIVRFRLQNVSARDVLNRVLELHHLAWDETPDSQIAIVIRANQITSRKIVNNLPATKTSSNVARSVPLIQFGDVPIITAVQNLAREAGINFLLDPTLFPSPESSESSYREPIINLRMKNVSADDVLKRMLWAHHYVLMEDPVSNIAIITHASQITNHLFAGMTSIATNTPVFHTDQLLPLIQFSDVPITSAIENLLRQAGVNYMIDPKVGRLWNNPNSYHTSEPILSIRLEGVTAWNALNRILNVHNLVLVDNPVTHIWRVTRSDEPAFFVDPSLLQIETNSSPYSTNGSVPLIKFQNVPLDVALENLIREAKLKVWLDPRIKDNSNPHKPIPTMSLRWEDMTAKQAIIALCENYDLVIVKDAATDGLHIKPRP